MYKRGREFKMKEDYIKLKEEIESYLFFRDKYLSRIKILLPITLASFLFFLKIVSPELFNPFVDNISLNAEQLNIILIWIYRSISFCLILITAHSFVLLLRYNRRIEFCFKIINGLNRPKLIDDNDYFSKPKALNMGLH